MKKNQQLKLNKKKNFKGNIKFKNKDKKIKIISPYNKSKLYIPLSLLFKKFLNI